MISGLTAKLEIDVMQASEIQKAVDFAIEHKVPSLIVHQQLVPTVNMHRSIKGGQFKIIVPVDWPKGESRGADKLRFLSVQALNADGFEILVSDLKSKSEYSAELSNIYNFVRQFVNNNAEIRFVLGTSIRPIEQIMMICNALHNIPSPDMLRTDTCTKGQMNKFSLKAHNELLSTVNPVIPDTLNVPDDSDKDLCANITKVTQRRLKISGNIDSVKAIQSGNAYRYGVNISQFDKIIADMKRINELRKQELAAKAEALTKT